MGMVMLPKFQKCERCKNTVPVLDTFKVAGMWVCQQCYRLYTHGNTKLVDPMPSGVKPDDSNLVYFGKEKAWYFT